MSTSTGVELELDVDLELQQRHLCIARARGCQCAEAGERAVERGARTDQGRGRRGERGGRARVRRRFGDWREGWRRGRV